MEQWEYHPSYDGVPQGSGISPILSNIYLSELDNFMANYKERFEVRPETRRRVSLVYGKASRELNRHKNEGAAIWNTLDENERQARAKRLKTMQAEKRRIYPSIVHDETYKRIQYVRYADDFIIGVIGSREDALQVKADVKRFLAERLKLTLSEEKTKITHTGDRARFLGYDITVSREQSTRKKKNGVRQRCHSYVVKLLVAREKWVGKLLEYKAIKIVRTNDGQERFKSLHRPRKS